MSEYLNITNDIISEIVDLDSKYNNNFKPLLLKLADTIAQGLKENKPEAINQSKMAIGNSRRHSKNPESIIHVSKILYMLRDKYFPGVSRERITRNLPAEYKEPRAEQEERESVFDVNSITDKDLINYGQEINRRYKKLIDHGPAQDIKIKKTLDHIKSHNFIMDVSDVLSDIIENLENDAQLILESEDEDKIKKLKEFDAEISRRLRTVSDKRNATDEARYEAILLACSTIDSLNNSTKYETEILTRWELFDREQKCRKCYGDVSGCRAEKCTCACHESVKRLTTKGLKWAKEHNPHLEKFAKQIEKISEWNDDICAFGKILLRNPHTDDYMTPKEKRNILANHITKEKCEQCEFFLDDHPNFFDE